MNKDRLRKQIEEQTQEYLDGGGAIETVPRIVFCPRHMEWARRRGWDYTPWRLRGFPLGGEYTNEGGDGTLFSRIGEGCYLTKPNKPEGASF